MSFHRALRRPVSTRHAFALAFDLTLLRDPLHSLVVPLLLRAPWILAGTLFSTNRSLRPTPGLVLILAAATLGGSITSWAVDAMLRFRARSVFNTPHGVPPAPALECYQQGLRRLPWLYVTELVRNLALFVAFPMLFVPGLYLGYKLAFATEAVVLNDRSLVGAFEHSFHLARGRFERWLEMVVTSVLIVLGVWFLAALVYAVPHKPPSLQVVLAGFSLLLFGLLPVFQYAWTFFYLRLVEVEEPQLQEVGPFYASGGLGGPWRAPGGSQPRLTLAEPRPPSPENGRKDGARAGSEPG
jgi:hypothetical protein